LCELSSPEIHHPEPAEKCEAAAALAHLRDRLGAPLALGRAAIISGATGAEPATNEERAWLETLAGIPVRATGTYVGHGLEPQFAMNIAIAALAIGHRSLFPPADSSGVEQPMQGTLDHVVVTSVGHWRGEGMALVEPITLDASHFLGVRRPNALAADHRLAIR
jgi:3-oxoacyl-[acyl-carrier-protein] synthase II